MSDELIVFAKAPIAGAVKTRLARKIGSDAALAAYSELLGILASKLRDFPSVTLQYSPPDALDLLAPLFPQHWTFLPQDEGDLGKRLLSAFAAAFDRGARKVVIIGSDCPYVSREHIVEAWQALDRADVVIGPASDGGYWLVGAKRVLPELFENISWGSSSVFAQSMRAAEAAQLRVAHLEVLGDVDTAEDWEEFCRVSRLKVLPERS